MEPVFFINIKDNKIIGKGFSASINEGQIEISNKIYNQLTHLPASFETDTEGNIISVTPEPKPKPKPKPTTEEILLAALQEIQALKSKVAELEGR